MSGVGWIKSHRQKFDNDIWRNDEFCRMAAFDWLCHQAAHKPIRWDAKGSLITIQRGELVGKIRVLAEAWNWKKTKVERFLGRLKTEAMIGTRIENGITIITICNYGKFQDTEDRPGTEIGTEIGTASGQHRDTNKNDKNEKKDSIEQNGFDFIPDETPKPEPKKRGTRIPSDWTLSEKNAAWAREKYSHIDISYQAGKFHDHWLQSAQPTAVKMDWDAAWRTWCKKTNEYSPPPKRALEEHERI